MKKIYIILCVLLAMMLAFAGCNSSKSKTDYIGNINAGENIKSKIVSELDSEDILLLWDGEKSLLVNVNDGKASITARVGKDRNIPEFAEEFCQIAIDAVKAENCELNYITLQTYDDTVDDGTLVNWNSYDGITGTFLIENENVIKSDVDIEYLKNYYGNIEALEDASKNFQGEWQCQTKDGYRLIINGLSLNFVSEGKTGNKSYCRVTSYEFGCNEDGTLVICNSSGKVCYTPKTDQYGDLHIVSETKDDIYTKISDSTEVPAEKVEPTIGMSEDEVLASTWGAPKKKNTTTTENGTHEQWVYEDGYIYFDDGIVTTIQEN